MRFPRNAKIFRGQMDAAPFAGVFFCLVILLLVTSRLAFTTGIHFASDSYLEVPAVAETLPGVPGPIAIVAVDVDGRLHYENQVAASREKLASDLKTAIKRSREPLTLFIRMDRRVTWEVAAELLAATRNLGFREVWIETRPKTSPLRFLPEGSLPK